MFTAYATYTSCLTQSINWTEKELNEKPLFDVTWDEIRSYIRFLKNIRQSVLNLRTINVHIAQLRDFFQYVLHRDWDRYRIPYLHVDEHLPKIPTRKEVMLLTSQNSTKMIYLLVAQLLDILSSSIEKGRPRTPSRNVVYSEPWLETMFSVADYELRNNGDAGFLCCEQ